MREKPKDRDEYSRFMVLGGAPSTGFGVLATWVPANEKNKKRNVPTNSPITAIMLFRKVSFRCSIGNWRRVELYTGAEPGSCLRCNQLGLDTMIQEWEIVQFQTALDANKETMHENLGP